MTVYCPAVDTSLGLRDWASTGVSDAARHVKMALEESLEHYLETRLGLLLPEIENLPVVCNETSIPVDPDTIRAATQFAYSLPRFVPIPEVSADPDGEISFDWTGPTGEIVRGLNDRLVDLRISRAVGGHVSGIQCTVGV